MKSTRKRFLFFALVASGVMAIALLVTHGVGASGQSELSYDATISATASVTAPPPWQPTILATQTYPSNFTCPTGLPIGWGTVTPNAAWNALCGQCVYTPFPTGTGAAPTTCPTIMVGGTPGFDCGVRTATPTSTSPVCIVPTATPLTLTPAPTTSPDVTVPYTSWTYVGTGWAVYDDGHGHPVDLSPNSGEYWQYTFSGTSVAIYASTFNNAGIVTITLDGSSVGVDEYSNPNVGVHQFWASGLLSSGSHTIRETVSGSKSGSSSGYYVGASYLIYTSNASTPTPVPNTVTCDPVDTDCTQDSPQHITLHAVDSSSGPGNWFYNGAFPFQSSIVGTLSGTIHTCYPFSDPQACPFTVSVIHVPATDYGAKDLWDHSAATTPYGESSDVSKDVTALNNQTSYFDLYVDGGARPNITWTYTIDVYAYITCLGTGTPTPGPTCLDTGGSYCDCVDAVTTCTDFCYTGFGPTGNGVCADVGPYSLTLFGIDLEIPWIAHVCFEEWLFGTAIIFGVSFSMDVVIFVVLIAWVVRNIVI